VELLLATKLHVPRVRADQLPRPKLVRRLQQAPDHRLLLVSAPPGFGKSTLLADWARGAGEPIAWVSLDADDNDPARFWRYLVAAVGRVEAGFEERVAPTLHVPEPALDVVVGSILNELAARPRRFALVLDDYHAIESPAIHESLTLLVERLPPGPRLVIATRGDPPLPLASLRARGRLTELRAADLRFTADEAVALLRDAWAVDLPQPGVAALVERTEGWVTGLQLAALSLRGSADPVGLVSGFTGGHRYVLDYLTGEVLERQPDRVRGFLLETSILERLSGPLCDAVTGRSGGQAVLEELERANLFLVPLDDERRWYRYHRLFADLLRVRLEERDRERALELHRRAAAWCDEHGLVDEAVRHALAAGDAGSAARIVERHVDEVLARGEGVTFRRWLAAIPPEVTRSRPGLCLAQAVATLNAGHLGRAEALLDDAERALAADDAAPSHVRPESSFGMVPATIATVRASLATARGRPERAGELAEQALSLISARNRGARLSVTWNLAFADWMLGRLDRAERAFGDLVAEGRAGGVQHLTFSAGATLARIQRAQGRLGDALRVQRESLEEAAAGGAVVPTAGMAHVGIAEVLYERDQLDDALRHVHEGVGLCRRLTSVLAVASGLATLAWILRAMGDEAGSREAMEEAYQAHPTPDAVSLFNPVPAEHARLLLADGDVGAAAAWVEELGLREADEPTYARELEYAVLARLLLARGEPDRARELVARLRSLAEAQGRAGSVVRLRILEALAVSAAGDRDLALAGLAETVALARPEGYVRAFADEGRPMAALLGALVTRVPADHLGRLLRAVRRPSGGGVQAPAGLVEPLTGRELEILEMVARGKSNRQIADELVVTLDTVKKHVTHVIGKLGATNRTGAVAAARALGLIQ
jgi:LuxR family transcriptional regulator, maltose regulon positive regulatory protein